MAQRKGIIRTADGTVRVTVGELEAQALATIPEQLQAVMDGHAEDASLRAVLFPPASHDPQIQQEYTELLGDTLAQEKSELLTRFAEGVTRGQTRGRLWSVDLDSQDVDAWLAVTNDMRHVLSKVVGITSEDSWEHGPDAEDPASMLLWWLGWLQERLIEASHV